MKDRELHRQKYQAQLDEWKAEVAKLRAKAAGARAASAAAAETADEVPQS